MRCLVTGAGGFIGHNLVKRLKGRGDHVVGIDIKRPEFEGTSADDLVLSDVSGLAFTEWFVGHRFDQIYALAANMGGMGFIGVGKHDAEIMSKSAAINLNVVKSVMMSGTSPKVFFSSSACIYPLRCQESVDNCGLKESDAYPADPQDEYGWEKLFSERLYLAYARNDGLDVRIARFHNIFGPMGTYDGGREKAPAAICRKVALARDGGEIEIWGDGEQTRSFLYIDDCLDGVQALMASECTNPVNIGSEEMVSINELARMTMEIAGKKLSIKHLPGPLGVRGRNSNNDFCKKAIGWEPKIRLRDGLELTYRWIESQVKK